MNRVIRTLCAAIVALTPAALAHVYWGASRQTIGDPWAIWDAAATTLAMGALYVLLLLAFLCAGVGRVANWWSWRRWVRSCGDPSEPMRLPMRPLRIRPVKGIHEIVEE